jgi:hypothetical protein
MVIDNSHHVIPFFFLCLTTQKTLEAKRARKLRNKIG